MFMGQSKRVFPSLILSIILSLGMACGDTSTTSPVLSNAEDENTQINFRNDQTRAGSEEDISSDTNDEYNESLEAGFEEARDYLDLAGFVDSEDAYHNYCTLVASCEHAEDFSGEDADGLLSENEDLENRYLFCLDDFAELSNYERQCVSSEDAKKANELSVQALNCLAENQSCSNYMGSQYVESCASLQFEVNAFVVSQCNPASFEE